MSSRPAISVVIPAYNEVSTVGDTLSRLDGYFGETGLRYELIVVDDGSSDGTAEVVSEAAGRMSGVALVSNAENRGKGAAVRAGVAEATGEVVAFVDADFPYSTQKLGDAIAMVQSGATDMAVGARGDSPSPASLSRRVLARSLSFVISGFVLKRVADVQCGMKVFSREVANRLFDESRLDGPSFDVEILYLADKYGYRVHAVPVRWQPREVRRSVFRESFVLARDLLRIRRQDQKGIYRPPRRCPVCFSDKVGSICQVRDHVVRVCHRCHCRFFSRFATRDHDDVRPSTDGVGFPRASESATLDPAEEKTCLRRTVFLRRYLQRRSRILEIGAGAGKLGGVLSREFDYVGIDLSDESARLARQRGVEVYRSRLSGFVNTGAPFDAVAMFGVLERIEDPENAFDNVRGLLSPGGLLIVVTPDTESTLCQLSGARWFAYDTPDGAIFYSRSGLIELLERLGFEVLSAKTDVEYSPHEVLLERVSRAGAFMRFLTRVALAVLPDPAPATFGRLCIVAKRRSGRRGITTPIRVVEPTQV